MSEHTPTLDVTETSTGPLAPLPDDVARVLGHLAQLIDGTLAVRGVGNGIRGFAAGFLRVTPSEVVATSRPLGTLEFQLTALALAEDLATHHPSAVVGEDQGSSPRWTTVPVGEESLRFPVELAAGFDAGTLARRPLVVAVDREHHDGFRITAWSRTDDVAAAEAALDDLVDRGQHRRNPFRGRCLQARWHPQIGLSLRGAHLPDGDRDDLVLPDSLWAELDRNVHGLFAEVARLDAAGLGTSRGLLLAGPPGTGKTAACRALGRELARRGDVTVVFVDAAVVSHNIEALYAQARALAPAMVVLEDVDLVVGHRGAGSGEALQAFLVTLDGALSRNRAVVTVATTNAPDAIDPAARRAARFDRILEVPLPDRPARARILGRYLERLDGEVHVDATAVALATDGWSGAELRALVGEAVLQAEGGPVTTDVLVAVARRDEAAHRLPGAYL
jgi:cell division protease FtsH